MSDLDSEGLAARGGVGAKKARRKKGNFSSKGPNWVHSLDGHDKLMGFQNSTFPLAIYGCLDTASRKLLWLRVWNKNCDPQLIGRWYLEHVMETKLIPAMIRVDKGTETGTMATIHAFLQGITPMLRILWTQFCMDHQLQTKLVSSSLVAQYVCA